ncbi:MAG: AEC family transporter [Oscillospiraceae bacterium]|nr:AEC family transporter [Oscillospiraceae bacterium]
MFSIVFQQVFIMFLLMLVGFIYAKATGMKKEECNRICNILLMIVTPCLLLSNLQRPFSKEILWELLFSLGLAAVTSLIAILAARFVFLPKERAENQRIERYGASFGNVGFIGIPLITGIFGAEYTVFAVVFVVVFHVLSWTVGVAILKGSLKEMSWKEALLNPGVLSALVAVPLFLFNITLPSPIGPVVNYISSLNTPLAMLVCGFFIAGVDWKRFGDRGVLYASLTRLVFIPLLTMFLYWALGIHRWIGGGSTLVQVNLIAGACPAAIATSMMAARYGLDGEYASVIVAVTTVGCLVTVPLIAMLGQLIFV